MPISSGRHRVAAARFLRPLAVLVICLSALFAQIASPTSAQASAAQQLAEKHAPISMLRQQEKACDKDGEGYFPASVDFLFNNPDILLKGKEEDGSSDTDPVLKTGFTPQDLVAAGPDTYMDFPGDPRSPNCDYEAYFKQKVEELGLQPTTYAKIVVDPVEKRLFLQYWFYYYFNDWNNTHETDWEMIQLIWDGASTAEEALERPPTRVGFAQHGGGELANWTDPKVGKEGDHPLAYSAAGSHSTYYGSHTYIGWGEKGTGFGCDSTVDPMSENPLEVMLVPDTIDPESEFAFFLYEGRWGERQGSEFNGPNGPNLGSKWNNPTESISTWRVTSLKVPDTSFSGASATDAFCRLSEAGSKAFMKLGENPIIFLAVMLGVLGIVGLWMYKVWPYFSEALDVYGNELRTFLGIGAMIVPIGVASTFLLRFLHNHDPFDRIEDWFNQTTGGEAATAALFGVIQQLAMIVLVAPAVIYATSEIRQGIKPGVFNSFRETLSDVPNLIVAAIIVFVSVTAMATSLLLVPLALLLLVRWQFFSQATILDHARPGWTALGRSWDVTRGKFVKTLLLTGGFILFAIIPGPLIGALVLIIGGSRVQFANLISAFVYALFVPVAVIGLTMAYRRLQGQEIIEPHVITRERDGSTDRFLVQIPVPEILDSQASGD